MSWIITGTQKNNWTPADIDTALWLDAADASTITEVGGAVSQWNDKSGGHHHVSQSLAGQRPTTGTRTLNGLNVIDFDGDILFTSDSIVSGNPNLTLAVVVLYDTTVATADRVLQISSGVGTSAAIAGGTDGYSWRFNNGNNIYDAITTGSAVLQVAVRPSGGNYASSRMFINGIETNSTSSSNPTATPNLGLGLSIGAGASLTTPLGTNADPVDGVIGEAIVIESDSVITRQRIEGYLAHKWGLTANLPADHPYKTAVPVP